MYLTCGGGYLCSNDSDGISLFSDGGSGLRVCCFGLLGVEACTVQGSVSVFFGVEHIDCFDESESDVKLSGILPGACMSSVFLVVNCEMVLAGCVEKV